jgi:uncharacterized protein (UPF0276 family)
MLGVGVGFRVPHYSLVVETHPEMDWFEVISENFMGDGGSPASFLKRLAAHYTVVPHGVSANLGGEEDPEHTRRLLRLVDQLDPPWVSDHLCWTRAGGVASHDLLPLPYLPEIIEHVANRIDALQQKLGRPFAVENLSSYATFKASVMPEAEFLQRIADRADCAILLDLNNVFVSACNHGFEPADYLAQLPLERVVQVHLAGHSITPTHRLDTHDGPVCDEVWGLYEAFIGMRGPVSTLIEWDEHIPSFDRLAAEAKAARDRLHAL